MSGTPARRAPSRPDVASLLRAFRPGRLAAAFLLAAFSFALAPDAPAQGLSAEELWIEHVGTDTTAPRIVSVRRTGREGERTSASTLGFEVTFSEPVHVDPGDLEIARSPGSWRRVEKDIGPHYDEQDRLKAAGDPYYKPCNPDEDRIYANLGTGAAWDLIERLDDECYRREQLSRHWHVLAGGGALTGTIYYEVDLVVASDHDMADVHGNRLDSTLPTGGAYQGYIIDRQGPSPRMTASVSEHDGSTPFTVTVDFRAPVWGFRAGDMRFNADRASVALTSGSDGASVYVLTVTPLNDTERLISLSLPRGVATDAAGNVNDRGGSVLVTGTPDPGVRFSTRALTVPEGGEATFTVRLTTQPTANVTVRIPGASGDADITYTPSQRMFTPANWSARQTFTVSAAEDDDSVNGTKTFNFIVTSTDTDYSGLNVPSLTVTEADNDRTNLSALSLTAGGSAVTLSPGFSAGTTSYTALVANDVDTVTVAATAAATGATVSISPADDDTSVAGHQVEGLQVGVGKEIRVTVTNAGATRTYTVTVTRTGPPGVTFSTDALSVPEGQAATYTVVLDTQPSANVVVGVVPSTGDHSINNSGAAIFDFTPANWSDPQTITLFALEDDDTLNGVRTIMHIISTTDTAYAALTLPSLTATEVDNDTALSALSLTDAGGSTVTLDPTFDADTTGYTASVANGVDTVTVAATAATIGATVSIMPADDDTSVGGHQVDLSAGENTITVTVADGTKSRTYTVTVTRAAALPATVVWSASLTVGTSSDIVGYDAHENRGMLSDNKFTPPGTSQEVTVTGLGRGNFNDIRRSALCFHTNRDLSSSVYGGWTLHFGDKDVALSGWVVETDNQNDENKECDTRTGKDKVGGVFTSDPTGTVPVCITTDGDDSVCPSMTGSTEAPADTTLSALSLSDTDGTEVTLSPAFAAGTTEYTASVANGVSTVTVTTAATAAGATLAVTPEEDADTDTAGHQVALSEGENEIAVTVTDGGDTETYTVSVTRAAAPAASEVLVSNLGQSQGLGGSFRLYDLAQGFRTGDNAGGYTLTAVDLQMSNAAGDISTISASVWSVSGGKPDGNLGALTNPGSLDTNRIARFTAPGIDLEPSTGYIVVFDSTGAGGSPSLTRSDDEDAGAASGWRVSNSSLYRGSSATAWSPHGQAGRIAVHGSVKAGAAGTEAPSAGLQARFGVQPAWHTGMPFWTELHFSAEPDIGYKDLRDKAFEVTGARITRAQRIDKGSSLSWRLLVEPSGFGDVSLTLPVTEDCAAEGAVCTKGGAPLETGLGLAVPGPGDRLAARLTGTSSHAGEAFRLKLHFSHEPNLSYRNVRDTLFAVTGGRITRAKRLEKGSNLGWRLTVEPDGVGAVGLELPATESCGAAGAVCTRDGGKLERGIAWTVAGPAAFSVSDAEANEGAGAALAFEVSLSRRLRAEARVDVSTQDGTATAGSDYEAVTRTLVFAPGETRKTVEVPVLDDSHDEGSETMTLALSNAQGAPIDDGEGLGTIVNSDAIPQAWLARFGRTVTGQVLDAVEERLAAPRRAGMQATLAGRALRSWDGGEKMAAATGTFSPGPGAANDDGATGEGVAGSARDGTALADSKSGSELAALAAVRDWMAHADRGADRFGSGFGIEGGQRTRGLSGRELLLGTSFALTAGSAEGGGHASLWGRVSVAGFDGREDALSLDGQVTTGLLGADWSSDPGSEAGRWTAGLALGHSMGTGGYGRSDCEAAPGSGSPGSGPGQAGAGGTQSGGCGGKIEAELTGLYPYAGVDLSERVSVWLAAGHGAGELTVIPDGQGAIATDMTMSMGAAGTRIALLKPEGEGLRLALKGDGRFTRTSSDAAHTPGGNLAEADADVWLLRVGLEGSRPIALGTGDGGATLTPSFELGVRRDGGDAETGFGADMGGGVALADPKHGLRLDLKGRALVAHEASGFREWGASAAFGWDPAPSTERGLAMSLTQSWGASPSGGMDGLLNRETMAGLAANDDGSGRFEASSRLSGEVGYGLSAFGGGFTGTPNLGFGMSSGGARDWRVGWRLTPAARSGPGFELNLDAMRRESASDDARHEVTLRGILRW